MAFLLVGVLAMGNPFHCCRRSNPTAGTPAALPVGTDSGAAALHAGPGATKAQVDPAACPFPELADQVVSVLRDPHGDPIWVLADGRQIRRVGGASPDIVDFQVVAPFAESHAHTASTR